MHRLMDQHPKHAKYVQRLLGWHKHTASKAAKKSKKGMQKANAYMEEDAMLDGAPEDSRGSSEADRDARLDALTCAALEGMDESSAKEWKRKESQAVSWHSGQLARSQACAERRAGKPQCTDLGHADSAMQSMVGAKICTREC